MFYDEKAKHDITLQERRAFLVKIYKMINLSNFEISKLKLEGTWCTEDFDNEHLQLRVFSATKKKLNATSCFSRGHRKIRRMNTNFNSRNNFI